MERKILHPDKKLFTKQIYVLLTISTYLAILGLIFQITIPLGKHNAAQVALVVWPIYIFVNILVFAVSLPLSKLWIKNLKYTIEDERIRLNKGIISKIEQTIPFKAVTDFQLHRSLFDRMLGIASIKIQTAGQTQSPSGYEAVFAGLSEWEHLIEELREKIMSAQRGGFYGKTVTESTTDENKSEMAQLLTEVTRIRELLEKKG